MKTNRRTSCFATARKWLRHARSPTGLFYLGTVALCVPALWTQEPVALLLVAVALHFLFWVQPHTWLGGPPPGWAGGRWSHQRHMSVGFWGSLALVFCLASAALFALTNALNGPVGLGSLALMCLKAAIYEQGRRSRRASGGA